MVGFSRRSILVGGGAMVAVIGLPHVARADAVAHGGIKVISLLVPRDGTDLATFRKEWLDVHAAAAAGIPNMRGFVLSELIADRPTKGMSSIPSLPHVVGMSESWWDSAESRDEARGSPQMKAWVAHGNTIIDRSRSLTFTLRDNVFRSPRPAGIVKRVGLMRRKEGTTREQCMQYWLTIHAPMHTAVPDLHGFVVSELVGPTAPTDFDGVVETWWESSESRRASLATAGGLTWNADGRLYLDFSQSRGFVTKEYVILPRPRPY